MGEGENKSYRKSNRFITNCCIKKNEIIEGKSPITSEPALKLERSLGRPAHFWNNWKGSFRKIARVLPNKNASGNRALTRIKERKTTRRI
jgi:plasmid maintenance system antidote protein VapI